MQYDKKPTLVTNVPQQQVPAKKATSRGRLPPLGRATTQNLASASPSCDSTDTDPVKPGIQWCTSWTKEFAPNAGSMSQKCTVNRFQKMSCVFLVAGRVLPEGNNNAQMMLRRLGVKRSLAVQDKEVLKPLH